MLQILLCFLCYGNYYWDFSPHFCQCNSVCTGIDKISKPYSEIKEASSEISVIISKKNADNNNTTQEEATDVMKNITPEDSSADIDLKKTPEDVLALMAEAKRQLKRKSKR